MIQLLMQGLKLGITAGQAYTAGVGLSVASIGFSMHMQRKTYAAEEVARNQIVDSVNAAMMELVNTGDVSGLPETVIAVSLDSSALDPAELG